MWYVNEFNMVFVQPITLALVYIGTTLKDLSDVTHGWTDFSYTRLVRTCLFFIILPSLLEFANFRTDVVP